MKVQYQYPDNESSIERKHLPDLVELIGFDAFAMQPYWKEKVKPFPEVHPFIDVMWEDGLVARNQCNKALNWDKIVAWGPCEVDDQWLVSSMPLDNQEKLWSFIKQLASKTHLITCKLQPRTVKGPSVIHTTELMISCAEGLPEHLEELDDSTDSLPNTDIQQNNPEWLREFIIKAHTREGGHQNLPTKSELYPNSEMETLASPQEENNGYTCKDETTVTTLCPACLASGKGYVDGLLYESPKPDYLP